MLGNFVGVTGAMLPVIGVTTSEIVRVSSSLSNSLDLEYIADLKDELQYIQNYTNSVIILESNNRELKHKERILGALEKGDFRNASRHLGITIDSLNSDVSVNYYKSLVSSEIDELKSKTEYTVQNRLKNVKTKDVEILSLLDLQILKKYKTSFVPNYGTYIKSLRAGSVDSVRAFGMPLYKIASKSPYSLLHTVNEYLREKRVDKKTVRDMCLQGVETVRKYYVTGTPDIVVSSRNNNLMSTANTDSGVIVNFEEWVKLKERDLGIDLDSNELVRLADSQEHIITKKLNALVESKLISLQVGIDLSNIYWKMFLSDNSAKYLCHIFDCDQEYALEDFKHSYSNLAKVGLFSLTLDSTKLMQLALSKLTFGKGLVTEIYPDQERSGYTFRKVLDLIESACMSLQEFGSDI